jgi:hypothetical protein
LRLTHMRELRRLEKSDPRDGLAELLSFNRFPRRSHADSVF